MRSGYRFINSYSDNVDLDDEFTLKDTWLDGNLYQFGELVVTSGGTTANILYPIKVDEQYDWRSVSSLGAGSGTIPATVAVKTNGTLWAWGGNLFGQLGQGDTTHRVLPTQIGNEVDWVDVSSGAAHTGALRRDRTLWVWGNNGSGVLGLGDSVHRSSPVQLGSRTDWKSVHFAFVNSAAIGQNGDLWVWGTNFLNTLVTGDTANRSSPTQIGSGIKWKQINFQLGLGKAITEIGSLWVWGRNDNGQLGNGDSTLTRYSTPIQVGSDTNWAYVSGAHAIKKDGTLWAWGRNNNGQLGLGDTTNRSTPVQVGALTTWKAINSTQERYAIALRTDGTLWSWGFNSQGQLGLDDTVHRSSPVQIGSSANWKKISDGFLYANSSAILDITGY
jgi:alpha-tubulin suppressor-like RCC1 family protein